MERKVIKMGESSLVISLPKEWTKKAKITRGSSVEIEELTTGEIVVKPKTIEVHRREVNLTPDPKYLGESIRDNYINGADVITITSKEPFKPDIMKTINKTTHDLFGLEVTEASGKRIVIEYYGGVMPIKKLVTRFELIITNYLKTLASAYREKSGAGIDTVRKMLKIDNLYYQLLRTLVIASTDLKAASEIGINTQDPVYYSLIINNLREMARQIENADYFETEHNEKVTYFLEEVLSCHRRFVEAWDKNDSNLAVDSIVETRALINEINMFNREVNILEEKGSPKKIKDISRSRVAKVKEMIADQEQRQIGGLLKILQVVLEHITGNLEVAALRNIE